MDMTATASEKKMYRKFGCSMAACISLVFGLLLPWIFNRPVPVIPFVIALLLCFWSLVAPGSLKLIYRPWMALARILGKINTTLVLALVYFLVFTSTALVLKLSGKDAMGRRYFTSPGRESCWQPVTRQNDHHMENMY
jgi:hypothetical protein